MKIRLLTVGKRPEPWLAQAIENYSKRLQGQFLTEIEILPSSKQEGREAITEESNMLLGRLDSRDYVILLDETGENITSPRLSQLITEPRNRPIIFVIGGAFGVDQGLMDRADFKWSLSKLVFPHQIVRLIVTEQIYRAQEIHRGGRYHHA